MERARWRSIRADAETALGLWRAMVDGRWSLLERFESGGRRILVARRNDPASRPSHALSELERKAVALLAVGHSQKLCAYELGRAESTIHEVAASAMRKMGVRIPRRPRGASRRPRLRSGPRLAARTAHRRVHYARSIGVCPKKYSWLFPCATP